MAAQVKYAESKIFTAFGSQVSANVGKRLARVLMPHDVQDSACHGLLVVQYSLGRTVVAFGKAGRLSFTSFEFAMVSYRKCCTDVIAGLIGRRC